MNSQQVQDIRLMYEAVYDEELRQKAEEYNNSSDLIDEVHAADTQYGVKSLINPYSVRSVVPRFPGLTLPEPDNSIPKVNIPKFSSPKGRTERRETPREKPKVTAPAAQKLKAPKTTTPPVVSQKPQLTKTPNPLMVDMPKGPGSMAAPEKPTVGAPSGPRTPISPGYFGGGVGTRPTGMSSGTSTVRGLDRSVTSGLTTKPQDEAQRKAREKSALSQRVAGYRSGGPSAGVREEVDLFDYLLEYLVAEGYADTNEAALAIMANMSEEWRQSIVEQDLTARQQYLMKKVSDMNAEKSGSAHTAISGKQSVGGALDRANRSAMQMRGV